MPPLLEQRCNGTTAGLGNLVVSWNCPCSSTGGQSASVRTAIFISTTDFNPEHNQLYSTASKLPFYINLPLTLQPQEK